MVHLRVAVGWAGGADSSAVPLPVLPAPASLEVTVVEDTWRLPDERLPLPDVEPPPEELGEC